MFEKHTGRNLTLSAFLDYFSLTPHDIYEKGTFQELCHSAGIAKRPDEKATKVLRNGIFRLLSSNSASFLTFCRTFFRTPDTRKTSTLSVQEKQQYAMLYYTFYTHPCEEAHTTLHEPFQEFFTYPWMSEEVLAVAEYLSLHLITVEKPLSLPGETALSLHGIYTRDQILAGLGQFTPTTKPPGGQREGVFYLKEKHLDIFFITLNKTEELYSPTTMYEDYAISDSLFHWQSQSTTSEGSPTGQRYIHHKKRGTQVLLFVRENKKLKNRAQPYTCLGTASYVRHDGNRPMNIVWRLDAPMPPRLLDKAMKMSV